jgi:hypothetical protein
MTESSRYVPPMSAAIACWAAGVVLSVFGLWFWLQTPSLSWYEGYLSHSNAWLMIMFGGGAVVGMPLYSILTLRGRLKQVS